MQLAPDVMLTHLKYRQSARCSEKSALDEPISPAPTNSCGRPATDISRFAKAGDVPAQVGDGTDLQGPTFDLTYNRTGSIARRSHSARILRSANLRPSGALAITKATPLTSSQRRLNNFCQPELPSIKDNAMMRKSVPATIAKWAQTGDTDREFQKPCSGRLKWANGYPGLKTPILVAILLRPANNSMIQVSSVRSQA